MPTGRATALLGRRADFPESVHDSCYKIAMPQGFFGFCTKLLPVELKAMGQLSQVLHLDENELVFSPGEPGDALYIINRGVVELRLPDAPEGKPGTYLRRGEMLGVLEALRDTPRIHAARTTEQVSLQCVRARDFDELARRVPLFFRYICTDLANRLSASNALSQTPNQGLELTGSLANFDLVAIYQTITNARQAGELLIQDERNNRIGAFFFKDGRPIFGEFNHLKGIEAFWQLFLNENVRGNFSFNSADQPENTDPKKQIAEFHGDMLITALQAGDELQAMRDSLPTSARLIRQTLNFSWPATADPSLRPLAEEIWQVVYSSPMSISELYPKVSYCLFKVYRTVEEMVHAGLFKFEEPAAVEEPAEEEMEPAHS